LSAIAELLVFLGRWRSSLPKPFPRSLIRNSIISEANVSASLAVWWWGAGKGSGEGAVPPPQEKIFFI